MRLGLAVTADLGRREADRVPKVGVSTREHDLGLTCRPGSAAQLRSDDQVARDRGGQECGTCQESTTTCPTVRQTAPSVPCLRGQVTGTPIARWWDMRKLGTLAIRLGMKCVWLLLVLSALSSAR